MRLYPDRPTAAWIRRLHAALLPWFRHYRRDLPWRRTADPYRIWVSEVMLQQTQVATAIPYFQRFLDQFPTLASLAEADEQGVLRLWEGLGYYRRAGALHAAARQLMCEHGGVPDDPELLARLPGFGRYTVGAVLSQAFDRRLPILEANSTRVLCRWFGCRDDPRRAAVRAWLWSVAELLLPEQHVGEFNQAVMELGALVCTPRDPKCHACPVAGLCAARRQRLQNVIPEKRAAAKTTHVDEVAVVIEKGPRVLLVQRPADAKRWANLWEFPHTELLPGESERAALRRTIRDLTGLDTRPARFLGSVRHNVTRFIITLRCYRARHVDGRYRSTFYQRGRWVPPARLAEYPLSMPQRKLARLLV
jgi:A/G-specific adenine glycosylase